MKNKTKFLLTTLFILVAFLLLGTTNVNAATLVETEAQLREALSGEDSSITEVKLGANIEVTNTNLIIYPVNDLVLDLGGFTIDGKTNSKIIYINYGKNSTNTTGSLTIKDSSSSKAGTIKSNNSIIISNYNTDETSTKNFKLIIEGGNYYSYYTRGVMFELNSNMENKNITFDFQVKDGYFDMSSMYGVFLNANGVNSGGINLNIKFDKLTFKNYYSSLISSDKEFTINDVVSAGSNVKIKLSTSSSEATVTDRNHSVSKYMAFKDVLNTYDTIEIIQTEGFDVSDVTLNETYGYTSATAKGIKITNRGANPLKVKNVSVSNTDGTDSTDFIVTDTVGTTDYLEIASLDSNETRYTIKAKTGLPAGEYTATITVTDENDKTYTSSVKVVVAKKSVEGLGIGYTDDWKYGETPTTLNKYGVDGLSVEQYVVDYSVHGAKDWSTTVPTLAGYYDVRIRVTDPNYDNSTEAITQFNIKPIDTQIKIVPNNHEWTYDGNSHSDNGYKVFYGDTEVTTGVLPTGDRISAVVSGSVTDVDDTKTANNKITSYTITNSDGVDVKACYSDIIVGTGNLKINAITTQIVVTAGSATKTYDGTALTQDSFTYTNGVILAGDTLKVVTKGSQTFVGTSDNEVSTEPLSVTVWRGEKNITSNYRFGTHEKGTLKVEAASQTPTIATQYVVKGNVITIDALKQAVSGTEGNLDFEIVSGNSFVEYVEGTGYKGKDLGIVEMKVTAQSLNVGGDASPEYSEGSATFNLVITNKEEVTIGGITDNQEFTYDGNTHTPAGTLTFTNPNVTTSDLEISYAGTGSTTYSGTTAPTNAGTYSVTYKIKDSNENYTGEQAFKFTIKKAQLAKVTLKQSSFVYIGDYISLQFNNFDSNLMTLLSGYGEAAPQVKNANSYNFYVSLKDKNNYEWADGTTDNIPLTVSVTKANPSYTIPKGLTGIIGQTLDDIELPDGFTWNNVYEALVLGTHTYMATYTPEDTVNYNVINNIAITVVTNKKTYKVVEGANQEYIITKDTEAKFRIDAHYGLFLQGGNVYVDNELVDVENYTSREGSTVITLKQDYVDTLAVGQHTLKVTFADEGEATTNFTVAKVAEKPTPDVENNNTKTENKEEINEEDNSSNPKTFDNIMVYVAIAMMSVVGLGATVVIKKKKLN